MSRTRKRQRRVDHNPKTCPWSIGNRTHKHVRQIQTYYGAVCMIDETREPLPQHVLDALADWGKLPPP